MTATASEIDTLIADVIDATGAVPPDLFAEDSPALADARGDGIDSIYFVGLVGGKDVGKSSLVNALVGLPVTEVTSHGPGTENVIAYAHSSAADAVEKLLARFDLAGGKARIVTHENASLARQVLLDLPDIDSVYADHLEITRRALRHTLYPIWLQSVEKYADAQPQKWLARVAEGNDPSNFLFAINKVDLVGEKNARELCDDFARRVARTLSLAAPPKVWALSAARPDEFDLPGLRVRLSQQRSGAEVASSQNLATRQRSRTLFSWLDEQDLAERAARADRLLNETEALVVDRLAVPLLEAAPRALDESSYRAALIEPAMRVRLSRWPIVNALGAVLSPIVAFAGRAVAATNESPAGQRDSAVDSILTSLAGAAPGSTPATRIAATFAHAARLHPDIGKLYQNQKLWEEPAAISAAADLRRRLCETSQRQRDAILERAGGRGGGAIFRWLLTVGAILWFPLIQPVLNALLAGTTGRTAMEIARLAVGLMSSTHLLQSVSFLLLWFVVLWMLVRWHTQQRAARLIRRWQTSEANDPEYGFATAIEEWTDDLLAPLTDRRDRFTELAEREKAMRS